MKRDPHPLFSEAEQALLTGAVVRLIELSERPEFDRLMSTEHYLRSAGLVGEQLSYEVEYQG